MNGVECFDCGQTFEDALEGDGCPTCGEFNVIGVTIEPCPRGVTRSDWLAGNGLDCPDEEHEFRSGNHITRIEQ